MDFKLDYTSSKAVQKKLPLCVLLDNVKDINNLGPILRIGDALCVNHLYWSGERPQQITKKIRRVSRGADSHLPFSHTDNMVDCIKNLKTEGYTILAVEITSQSQVLHTVDFQKIEKIALVMGAENLGISAEVLSMCDFAIHIPMFGIGFSMNVTSALSITLYEIVRQKIR